MSESKVGELVRLIKAKPRISGFPVKLIAIDGHGGAGKSTLAVQLAKELNAEILHTDDFASWDNPYDWWPKLIELAFDPIKNGSTSISYPRSSWAPDHYPEPVRDQKVTQIMILEGVSSTRKEFRPYLSYSIWVEAPKGICIKRGVNRDGEGMRQRWKQWWNDEEKYIQEHKPHDFVDITVSGV